MASSLRLYARIAIVGFWSVLLGGVVAFLVAQLFSVMATATPTAGETAGLPVRRLVLRSLGHLVDLGLAGVGVGLVLLLVGGWLLLTTVSPARA